MGAAKLRRGGSEELVRQHNYGRDLALHFSVRVLLVLLVNDSEYSQSTGAKPILSPSCIYLVSPGVARPQQPRPPFAGEESTKKENRVRRRGGQGVGEVVVYVCSIWDW